jgi:hypothetical protein
LYPEHEEQVKVAQYLHYRYPKVLFTSSVAGVKHTMMQNKRLKDAGYRKGTPDILILEPRKGCHALFIEMKDPKLKHSKTAVSVEQTEFLTLAENRGYAFAICYGFDEAQPVIDEYFNGEKE